MTSNGKTKTVCSSSMSHSILSKFIKWNTRTKNKNKAVKKKKSKRTVKIVDRGVLRQGSEWLGLKTHLHHELLQNPSNSSDFAHLFVIVSDNFRNLFFLHVYFLRIKEYVAVFCPKLQRILAETIIATKHRLRVSVSTESVSKKNCRPDNGK